MSLDLSVIVKDKKKKKRVASFSYSLWEAMRPPRDPAVVNPNSHLLPFSAYFFFFFFFFFFSFLFLFFSFSFLFFFPKTIS